MPKRARSYRTWQLQKLTDPRIASAYLNESLADSNESFLKALGKVAQANQMSKVAKDAGIQRETLYRSFSEQGNPTATTLVSVLKAVGLKLEVSELLDQTGKQTTSGGTGNLLPLQAKIQKPNISKAHCCNSERILKTLLQQGQIIDVKDHISPLSKSFIYDQQPRWDKAWRREKPQRKTSHQYLREQTIT